MEPLTLGLLLIAAVLASSVLDQVITRVSLPLLQIAMGLVIALAAPRAINITLDPELFLVLFIAPLLYDEAKNANKAALWHDRKPILSLAIGLVVATVLVIGFTVHAVIPSIPLAAAFALGAALGPTDAVAVTSLSKHISIPERQKSILQGELLLNDASGIVSFQFALAAAITGTFSLADATTDFLIEFFGGLLLGVVLGLLGNLVVRKVRAIGVENSTFHVLFEVLTPFLVYLAANACHVSGIIAVVVAGLINVISPRLIGPSISHMNIVSSNVWHVLAFALNGIVFVMLGTQLPNAMMHTWDDPSINNFTLVLYALGLTLVLMAVRFAWIFCMEYLFVRRKKNRAFRKGDAKTALISTLCGAKGTITLSIMFSIPVFTSVGERFPQRDLLIFLACGVIVCTLLMATYIVPLLAPKKKDSEEQTHLREIECQIEIARRVIEELTAHRTPENRSETRSVIRAYNKRISDLKDRGDIYDGPNTELRIKALHWEQERVLELIEAERVPGVVGYKYLANLEHAENLLKHSGRNVSWRHLRVRLRALARQGAHALVNELPNMTATAQADEMRKLQIEAESYAAAKLENLVASSEVPTEDVTTLLLEYQRSVATLRNALPSVTSTLKAVNRTDDVKRLACRIELDQIQSMYEEGRLSRTYAKRLRENVYLMQLDLESEI